MNRPRTLLIGAVLAASAVVAACSSGTPSTGATVLTASVGSNGTLVVAGSNGMTVYQFSKDVAGSGTSACTGTCATKWPALTVPAGTAPTAGTGATGAIGTITRSDNSALQVTYKGLPLYFFSGDKAVGDSNGIYPGWSGVTP